MASRKRINVPAPTNKESKGAGKGLPKGGIVAAPAGKILDEDKEAKKNRKKK